MVAGREQAEGGAALGDQRLLNDLARRHGRLAVSFASFAGECAPVEAWHTLMLEETATGRVEGVAGAKAAEGRKRPFFSFQATTLAQHCAATGLGFDHQVPVL